MSMMSPQNILIERMVNIGIINNVCRSFTFRHEHFLTSMTTKTYVKNFNLLVYSGASVFLRDSFSLISVKISIAYI